MYLSQIKTVKEQIKLSGHLVELNVYQVGQTKD